METGKRKYKIGDAYMKEFAKDMRNLFSDDLAIFTAFYAAFNAAFLTDWSAKIDLADVEDTDETVVDVLGQYTAEVETAMKKCRLYYNEVKFFVIRVFPDKIDTQNEFGFDNYDGARKSQPKMIEFMRGLHNAAVKYTAELTAEDFGIARINIIKDLADQLDQANQAQNKFKDGRPVLTTARVTLYNEIWDIVTLVARAAKVIFAENPPKFNQYLLPASDESDEFLALKGKVTDAATEQPIVGAQLRIDSLSISVTTDSEGKYGMGAILVPGSYELTCNATGYVPVTLNNIPIIKDKTAVQKFTLEAVVPEE